MQVCLGRISCLFQSTFLTLPPGTIVRVSNVLYEHVGMLGDRLINGERAVIVFSAHAGGFEEVPLSRFGGGRPVTLKRMTARCHESVIERGSVDDRNGCIA